MLKRRAVQIVGLIALAGCGRGLDEISVYPVRCEGVGPGRCVELNRITFGVSAEQQFVLEWTPGISDIPVRLAGCVVRDVENWTCFDVVTDTRRRMERGSYTEEAPPDSGRDDFVFRTRWQFWLQRLGLTESEGATGR